MAVVDFGGSLRIVQNFTANPDVSVRAFRSERFSVDPTRFTTHPSRWRYWLPSFGSSWKRRGGFWGRSMLLAVRSLAKISARSGVKMVVLFSGGFRSTQENQSELTATIDAATRQS